MAVTLRGDEVNAARPLVFSRRRRHNLWMAKIKRPGAGKQRSTKREVRAMPQFTKAPPELVDTFNSAIANMRGVEMRHMFGLPRRVHEWAHVRGPVSITNDHAIVRG